MKIVVSGATGFIGSGLASSLVEEDHEVLAIARKLPDRSSAAINWIQGNLVGTAWNPQEELPERVDAVIHLAQSYSYREFPEKAGDVFEVNTASTFRLLDYARMAGASHFIYASSGSVYSGIGEEILAEGLAIPAATFSESPLGFYCATKFCGETLVEAFRPQIPSVSSLRIFAPYGQGGDSSLVNRLVAKVVEGELIEIQGNPGLKLNPIHSEDIHRAIKALLGAEKGAGILNVAGNQIVSLKEIVEMAGEISGREPRIRFAPSDPPEGPRLVADVRKLKSLIGGDSVSLSDGIRTLLR